MMRSKLKKKKWYDDDADWVPQKGMQFVMKKAKTYSERKEAEPALTSRVADQGEKQKIEKIKNDAEGLSKAYDQGDVFEQDDKMFIAGSHTARDWFGLTT